MIRKMFTSTREPNAKRIFCGYCGTHLTYWCEKPETEANFLNITVGSLLGDDIRTLEQLGLLPTTSEDPQANVPQQTSEGAALATTGEPGDASRELTGQRSHNGLEWMEEIITGTWLGKHHKARRGFGVNAGGLTHIEWEVTEVGETSAEPEIGAGRSKRKLDDVGTGEDAPMQL